MQLQHLFNGVVEIFVQGKPDPIHISKNWCWIWWSYSIYACVWNHLSVLFSFISGIHMAVNSLWLYFGDPPILNLASSSNSPRIFLRLILFLSGAPPWGKEYYDKGLENILCSHCLIPVFFRLFSPSFLKTCTRIATGQFKCFLW